jgi:hypothetical protein
LHGDGPALPASHIISHICMMLTRAQSCVESIVIGSSGLERLSKSCTTLHQAPFARAQLTIDSPSCCIGRDQWRDGFPFARLDACWV